MQWRQPGDTTACMTNDNSSVTIMMSIQFLIVNPFVNLFNWCCNTTSANCLFYYHDDMVEKIKFIDQK